MPKVQIDTASKRGKFARLDERTSPEAERVEQAEQRLAELEAKLKRLCGER